MADNKTNLEFDSEKEALNGEDFDAWETTLEEGQKDYSNLLMREL